MTGLWLLLAAATPGVAPPDLAGQATRDVDRQFCRSAAPDEITVCARRSQRERYRVTDPNAPFDVHGNVMSVMRERSRWIEGGEAGIGSCSAVGPGGFTGCLIRQWQRNDLQNPRRTHSDENDAAR